MRETEEEKEKKLKDDKPNEVTRRNFLFFLSRHQSSLLSSSSSPFVSICWGLFGGLSWCSRRIMHSLQAGHTFQRRIWSSEAFSQGDWSWGSQSPWRSLLRIRKWQIGQASKKKKKVSTNYGDVNPFFPGNKKRNSYLDIWIMNLHHNIGHQFIFTGYTSTRFTNPTLKPR